MARRISSMLASLRSTWRERDRFAGRVERRPDRPTRRVPHGTTVEYSPDLDGAADPGEVVWTWVPYEDDPSQGKDRPVVVIGRAGADLAGVPLTSKDRGHGAVAIGTGSWDRSGRPSYAKVDQLVVVSEHGIRREGAVLDRAHFDQVVAGVARHHDLTTR